MDQFSVETLGCVVFYYEAGIQACACQNPSETAQSRWYSQSLRPSTPALPTLALPPLLVSEEHPSPPPELGALLPEQSLGLISLLALSRNLGCWCCPRADFLLSGERLSAVLPETRLPLVWPVRGLDSFVEGITQKTLLVCLGHSSHGQAELVPGAVSAWGPQFTVQHSVCRSSWAAMGHPSLPNLGLRTLPCRWRIFMKITFARTQSSCVAQPVSQGAP